MAGPDMLIGAILKAMKVDLDPSQVKTMIEQAKEELPKLIGRANMALSIVEQRLGAIEKSNAEILRILREQSTIQ